MINKLRSEYIGFTVDDASRAYRYLVRTPEGRHYFTLTIPNRSFLSNRVRYQDAAEICFLRLERELGQLGEAMPESHFEITDAELDEYREAHTKKPPPPRVRPTPKE